MKIFIYNQNKRMAMKEANLIFTYVRRAFPGSRYIVEDFDDAEALARIIRQSSADMYVLSAVGDGEKNCLKLASEIRLRQRNRSILFVLNDLGDLAYMVNASFAPDYVFVPEVTEGEIDKFFTRQNGENARRNLLVFTSDSRRHIVGTQTIVWAQTAGKKTSLKVSDRTFSTALTIAELEGLLPDSFVRADKGLIINSSYIRAYDAARESVRLIDGQDFPVSRRGQKRLFEAAGVI